MKTTEIKVVLVKKTPEIFASAIRKKQVMDFKIEMYFFFDQETFQVWS